MSQRPPAPDALALMITTALALGDPRDPRVRMEIERRLRVYIAKTTRTDRVERPQRDVTAGG